MLSLSSLAVLPSIEVTASAFAERVAVAFSSVVRTASYIDTLHILASPSEVSRACDAIDGLSFRRNVRNSWCYRWPRKLTLSQPSAELIKSLSGAITDYRISRLDVALDFICRDESDVAALRKFVDQHLTQMWPSRCGLRLTNGTAYLRRGGQRRNVLWYSDRLSKLDGSPCLHVEMRFIGSADVRRIGVELLKDALEINPELLAQHELRLSALNMQRFKKAIRRITRLAARDVLGERWKDSRSPAARALMVLAHGLVASEEECPMMLNWEDIAPHRWRSSFPGLVSNALVHCRLPFSGTTIANALFNQRGGE